jgi:hypothetical protein
MTPAKAKSGGLSETAKSFIVTWYKEQLYDRRKEIQSKYMSKGNACEDVSIAYLNQLYGTSHSKNEDHFNDDYLHGTPDIITEDTIIDVKNSWDFTTFPLWFYPEIQITEPVQSALLFSKLMQYIKPDVATICTGMAASMGAVLMCAGAEGKRSALKHARVMIHQPLGGAQGQASDIEITAREIQKLKKELYDIIAHHSHQTYDKVWADSDRDYWMTAEEAKAYGMVDEVLLRNPK